MWNRMWKEVLDHTLSNGRITEFRTVNLIWWSCYSWLFCRDMQANTPRKHLTPLSTWGPELSEETKAGPARMTDQVGCAVKSKRSNGNCAEADRRREIAMVLLQVYHPTFFTIPNNWLTVADHDRSVFWDCLVFVNSVHRPTLWQLTRKNKNNVLESSQSSFAQCPCPPAIKRGFAFRSAGFRGHSLSIWPAGENKKARLPVLVCSSSRWRTSR